MAQIETNMLTNMVAIIDICSKRGAFEGSELSGIARVRELLVQKIQEDQPIQDSVGESVESKK